jgi:MFS family permease
MGGLRRALVAAAAALALADASIVALALPPILVEMDTTIAGVAAIVGVYALVLALAVIPAERLGAERAGPAGLGLFAAASVGCAVAGSLGLLLAFRALQAAGGAAALLAAFHVLHAGESRSGRRVWLGAAVAGTAAGPAIGGALTEVFDWRAIFVVQAPIAAAAALACLRPALAGEAPRDAPPRAAAPDAGLWSSGTSAPREAADGAPARDAGLAAGGESAPRASGACGGAALVPLAALACTAAAFTAVLFLLVIELVAGFAISPLRAASAVTVLPLAALAAAALGGPPRARAPAGALLLSGGAAALAFLPAPGLAWTLVPQVLAGAGMGLALPAFAGELLPERDVADAARVLVARHVGIVVVLAILAPVATARLQDTTERAILQGAALVLDAQIAPLQKLQLAPALLVDIDAERPRAGLRDAVESRRADFADDAAVYDRLAGRLDDVVVVAVQDAFRIAYLIAAALALLAAALLASAWRHPAVWAAAVVAAACFAGFALESDREAPPAVALQDPCRPRALPQTGGLTGLIQERALKLLDQSACSLGTTREELALALFDPDRAHAFERRYGVDPRSAAGLLSLLGG